MCRVIAVSNQKGGVGKTVSCVNLGIGLAQEGKKVLLIDADPQGSLTISLGYEEPDEMEYSLATLMLNVVNDEKLNMEKTILHHGEGVDLIPANIELSAIEVSLVNAMSRELILRSLVDKLREFYDFILIDCMPSLGMMTINALACADSVLIEAKVLYGLMLDRMSLSMKNQWFDTEGRAYIYYSLEDIMDAMGCSNKKAISIMKELDIESGIGLIEKKRQGQGKPTMIYLKQFMIQDAQKCNNYISGEKSAISEVKNLHVLKCKNVMSRSEEITHPEVKKLHTNKNNINNTELSNTESNHIISGNDGIGFDVEGYTEIIKENIELDILLERYPYDRELLTGIFDLILETVLCKNKSIVVASSEYPAELVRSKFLKLNMFHVEYAMDCMRKNTSKIHNIKKYLLAALFNAPSTISGYYQAEVNHDLPQYAANDK